MDVLSLMPYRFQTSNLGDNRILTFMELLSQDMMIALPLCKYYFCMS